jgi:glyoxylase-like metal-dependent hydrolase (beta-lactamase superfamily II)
MIVPLMYKLDNRFCPAETSHITERLCAVKSDIVNLYLFVDGDTIMCFDAGNYRDKNLRGELKRLDIAPQQITHLFITHSDMDHVGMIELFSHAKMFFPAKEEPMVNGTTCRISPLYYNYFPVHKAYTRLKDQEIVEIGDNRIEVIETPGHTPGHVCYLLNNEILITGDLLVLKEKKAELFWDFYNMDSATQKHSIKRLKQLNDISIVCTAHTGYTLDYGYAMQDI